MKNKMRKKVESKATMTLNINNPVPLKAKCIRTVRFQEVDILGIVWHGRYIEYFEDGRCALGKTIGLDYSDFFRERIKAPIVKLEINYGFPLVIGDIFQIETSLIWTEAVRLNHSYEIRRVSDNNLICQGNTVQLLLNKEDKLLLIWPEYFRQLRERWKCGELKENSV